MGNPQLQQASNLYDSASKEMNEFINVFPFSFEGELPLEKRKKGIKILSIVHEIMETALEHFENAMA